MSISLQSRLEISICCIWIMLSILIFSVTGSVKAQNDSLPETIDNLDLARIEALYALVNQFTDSLWPDFDITGIPIAVNNDDKQEILIAHPDPPEEFRLFEGKSVGDNPVYIRDGCTIFGPRGGGWATEIGDIMTAYVGVLQEDLAVESYLSLLLHECFHVYQPILRQRADSAWGELPELDDNYSALLELESRILHRFLTSPEDSTSHLAPMFVAVRQERRTDLPQDVILAEGEEEFNEGTPSYLETRLFQLLARQGGIEKLTAVEDPQYHGFKNAADLYDERIQRILPPPEKIVTFFHAKYNFGTAQCLLLDRLMPGWKSRMNEKGSTQFGILEELFPLTDQQRLELLAEAKERFEYDDIFARQHQLIAKQIEILRGMVEAPGRRYQIYFGVLPPPFKWKPKGPVHIIPNDLMAKFDEELNLPNFCPQYNVTSNRGPTIWEGGIARFEMGPLVFESKEVPILFRLMYFEWIDTDPAPDESDLIIESNRLENDIYYDLKLTTDAFVLTISKARVERTEKVVAIIPVPDETE